MSDVQHNNVEPPQSPSTAATQNNSSPQSLGGDENSDDEPSPWRNSRAKQRVISSLKDATSEILELKQIHLKFAPRYLFKRFKSNYKRLLAQFEGKTGVFAEQQSDGEIEEEPEVEAWYTAGRISKGYSLLYNLYMEPEGTGIESMSVRELWQSDAHFRCYEFELFEEYNRKMINLTKKHKKLVDQDEADFKHDMSLFPEKDVTLRGEPFWFSHPAKLLLKGDIKSGLLSSMKPSELRQTRDEYKAFSPQKFCKEVHHEKQRQRAKPFWVWNRNKDAREIHEKEVELLRKEWMCSNDQEVNELSDKLGEMYRNGRFKSQTPSPKSNS